MRISEKQATRLIRIVILAWAVLSIGFYFIPVKAIIAQPDSTPTLPKIYANRNLAVTGDVLLYGEYNIPYASTPSILANEAFSFRLMDPTGVTEIGAVLPVNYFTEHGFTYGGFAFYFASGLTWGSSYIIRITENPAQFASPVNFDIVVPASVYSSETTQAHNRTETAGRIADIAADLETRYTGYTLLGQSAAGNTILDSPYGTTYFLNVIPGLQQMVPSLFLVQVATVDLTDTAWTTAHADNWTNRFAGTWVATSENATSVQFGLTTGNIMGIGFIGVICIGAIILSRKAFQKTEYGLIFSSVVMICGALLGWLPIAIFATANQVQGIYIAYLWFYARG